MMILEINFIHSYKYLLSFQVFHKSYENISRLKIFQLFLFYGGHIHKGTFNDIIVKYFTDTTVEVMDKINI